MENIYLANKGIIEDICERNITPEGELHADGVHYDHIDIDVGAAMFSADLQSGKNLYYPEYPAGLREQWGALSGEDRARQSSEFLEQYRKGK